MYNIKHVVKKIGTQFYEMKDGWKYLYLKSYRFNKVVPIWIAGIIAKMNERQKINFFESNQLVIPTYDGSMQIVHPDIIYWKGGFWLACTPYPYGIDTYENPCIYYSDNTYEWCTPKGCNNPLAFPVLQKKGYHLSDPCLVVFKDNLLLYYRETHKVEGVDKSHINMSYSNNGLSWNDPITIMKSDTDTLISPALLSSNEYCLMFHVRLDNPYGGTIILNKSDDGVNWINEGEVKVENLPKGMVIWHISIMSKKGYGKEITEDKDSHSNMIGIFLLRELNTVDVYKLYWAAAKNDSLHWEITGEVNIPDELHKHNNIFYKSTVIPETGDLLISGRDYKHRWYLYSVPKKETICERGNYNVKL